eukprot:PhF_6_TR11222/c0_g1_i3/m.18095
MNFAGHTDVTSTGESQGDFLMARKLSRQSSAPRNVGPQMAPGTPTRVSQAGGGGDGLLYGSQTPLGRPSPSPSPGTPYGNNNPTPSVIQPQPIQRISAPPPPNLSMPRLSGGPSLPPGVPQSPLPLWSQQQQPPNNNVLTSSPLAPHS